MTVECGTIARDSAEQPAINGGKSAYREQDARFILVQRPEVINCLDLFVNTNALSCENSLQHSST